MKICPGCREEFLDHIQTCELCNKDLVEEGDELLFKSKGELLSKEELLKSEMIIFTEGVLPQCRELEKVLNDAMVSCAVYPVKTDYSNQALGASSDMKYQVLIRMDDLALAQEALQGHFRAQIVKEGQGDLVKEVVDLSKDVITCPACLESVTLNNGECPSCGLALGVLGD